MVRAQDSYPLVSGRQFDPAPRYRTGERGIIQLQGWYASLLLCHQGI